MSTLSETTYIIWLKAVPLKVNNIFSCLCSLITFLQQITYSGWSMLQTNAQLYVGGCDNHEDAGHLFLRGDFFLKEFSH